MDTKRKLLAATVIVFVVGANNGGDGHKTDHQPPPSHPVGKQAK